MGSTAPTSPASIDPAAWSHGRHYDAGPAPTHPATNVDSWATRSIVSPEDSPHPVDDWMRPAQEPHRRITDETDAGHDPVVEAPLAPYLSFTAGWFGIPALFYLIWLITLDDDRQSLAGRQLVTNLPWLFMAVVLALALAGLLRWVTVGWRPLTTSFAAAVIGAGFTTITHSLTF